MSDWKQQTLDAGLRIATARRHEEAHNSFRKEHGSVPLQWSEECYESARAQANACRSSQVIRHSDFEVRRKDACFTRLGKGPASEVPRLALRAPQTALPDGMVRTSSGAVLLARVRKRCLAAPSDLVVAGA